MSLSLGNRIMGLVVLLVAMLLVMGAVAFWANQNLGGKSDQATGRLGEAGEAQNAAGLAGKQYQVLSEVIISRDLKGAKRFDAAARGFGAYLKKLAKIADTAKEKTLVKELAGAQKRLAATFKQEVLPEVAYQNKGLLGKLDSKAGEKIGQVEKNSRVLVKLFRKRLEESIKAGEYQKVIKQAELLDAANQVAYWTIKQYQAQTDLIINHNLEAVDHYLDAQAKMDERRKVVEQGLESEEEKAAYKRMGQAYEWYDTMFMEEVVPAVKREMEGRLAKAQNKALHILEGMDKAMAGLIASLNAEAGRAVKGYRRTAGFVGWLTPAMAGTATLLGLLLGFFLARSIARPIRRVSESLKATAEQVAAASGEVSSSSQSLASGASQQAANLEQTSAALQELASQTHQNADDAAQADSLMQTSGQVVRQAVERMDQLRQAMEGITQASHETGRIIKSIDEIAFQTNLLALNAAVEAARAGEAGAGFAVVADEVRNLAMRAAEAASNTTGLIEQNIEGIKHGSELADAADQAFHQVQESAAQVGELVSRIAGASGQQAEGLDQVNRAAQEMDRITQEVAAGAEQAAAAGEQLTAQSRGLREMVLSLFAVVEGGKAGSDGDEAPPQEPGSGPARTRLLTAGSPRTPGRGT